MIKKMNIKGQTALILILLAAAALIFLAITLNWGRIAQTKTLLTTAVDVSTSLMASDAASYGEMQKQSNLKDTNQVTGQTGILLSLLLVVIAIIVTVVSWGSAGPYMAALLVASVAMAVANLVLQVVVIQPGITSLWNSLQKDQPIPQQFYEGGVSSALQGSVGDQVSITDYFDWNANGQFGLNSSGSPNDIAGRFAVFYTDRLKMLNTPPIPQVAFFYDQLSEFINGEDCAQNESDHANYPFIPLNPTCSALGVNFCVNNPIDPACEIKIPNVFQLHDACTGSDPTQPATYNPYCDPCCQLLTVPGTTPPKALRPSGCSTDTSASGAPAQCLTNNPYGGSLTLLYDPTFQNYAAGLSFLAQFGRDQQMGSFTTTMTLQGSSANGSAFPNGVYPFFWMMNDYSPEVDNITPGSLQSSQVHWCAAGGSIPLLGTAPTGFSDLGQLTLPYACQGADCCVNYLDNSVVGNVPAQSGSNPTNGVIDMVGASSMGSNPSADPSFGEGGTGSWLGGDNQMCLSSWTYNGSSLTGIPDGTCEWTNSAAAPVNATPVPGVSTVDRLDDTMHTLSDFVNFSNVVLSNNIGTLSATFQTWYPQAATWIDPATGRLPPLLTNLNSGNTVITNWLNTVYTSSNAWCLPSEVTLLNGNGSTAEDTYIKNNSSATWGDLPHVTACLNYNATVAVTNYQACLTALTAGACPASLPAACAPSILGRSLVTGTVPSIATGCNVNTAGSYGKWVNDSLTLATDEAPKFALRAAFLLDTYNRAQSMAKIFQSGYQALNTFLAPCSGSACSNGGPAAQLTYAYSQPSPTSSLPNSVIYGWVDNLPGGKGGCTDSSGNRVGCAHIVKVTAYSVGRTGSSSLPAPSPYGGGVASVLPWIQTTTSECFLGICLQRKYTLMARDGEAYASVKRWDEDHGNTILFPNGHTLWQFLFHHPNGVTSTGQGLMQVCNGLTLPSGGSIGFGLEPQTVTGLSVANISSQDVTALSNAFMLNDNVNGTVDPNARTSGYAACLSAANALLANAPESHVCAQYIASRNASGPSGNPDTDYSVKFVSCPEEPEDLGYADPGL